MASLAMGGRHLFTLHTLHQPTAKLTAAVVGFLIPPGDTFKTRIGDYLKAMLRKGVPSLFVNLKPLYTDPTRVAIIQELMLSYLDILKRKMALDDDGETVRVQRLPCISPLDSCRCATSSVRQATPD